IFCTVREFRIGQDVRNLDRSALEHGTARSAASARTDWILGYKIFELLSSVEGGCHPKKLTIAAINECPVSSTQPDRAFGNGFKHRLKVKGRATDDLKHLRRGSLLLQ